MRGSEPYTLLQPCIPRAKDRLGAICHLKFAKDVADMIAHSLSADDQLLSNILIAGTLCHQLKDFSFAAHAQHDVTLRVNG